MTHTLITGVIQIRVHNVLMNSLCLNMKPSQIKIYLFRMIYLGVPFVIMMKGKWNDSIKFLPFKFSSLSFHSLSPPPILDLI